jgi:hypothetical protein
MDPNMLANFDVSRIMPLYCRLMGIALPFIPEDIPKAYAVKMVSPELIHAWNTQNALSEVKAFGLAVLKESILDESLLAEGIKAFQVFAKCIINAGFNWPAETRPSSYGDGELVWEKDYYEDTIDDMSLYLYMKVLDPVASRVSIHDKVSNVFRMMTITLDAAPFIYSSAYSGYFGAVDREAWCLRALATANFLETVRKVNAHLGGTTKPVEVDKML